MMADAFERLRGGPMDHYLAAVPGACDVAIKLANFIYVLDHRHSPLAQLRGALAAITMIEVRRHGAAETMLALDELRVLLPDFAAEMHRFECERSQPSGAI